MSVLGGVQIAEARYTWKLNHIDPAKMSAVSEKWITRPASTQIEGGGFERASGRPHCCRGDGPFEEIGPCYDRKPAITSASRSPTWT